MVQPLKWHGGKHYLAPKIVALMPPHLHYVEPFAGGLSVLLAKDPEGVSEVVNDLNVDLSNFWGVLQNKPLFDAFHRVMQATPFSQLEYDAATDILGDASPDIPYGAALGISDPRAARSVALACGFFIRCRQSMSGRMKCFTPLTRRRLRRGMNEQASSWISVVDGLPEIHARLRRVVILDGRKAVDVIRQQDGPETLFYCDPPYVHETRGGHTPADYAFEMTDQDHLELLCVLAECKGKWMLSGYPSALYESFFKDFPHTLHTFDLPNHAASGDSKRRMTECVWTNF